MKYKDFFRAVFREDLVKESYKMIPHNMAGRIGGKPYCVKCGLISLNNDFTHWSIDKGCSSEAHPSYKSQRARAGGIK